MPDESEFHTVGAATLKPREAKIVRTQRTDNRLVFAQRRERVGGSVIRITLARIPSLLIKKIKIRRKRDLARTSRDKFDH